MRWGALVVDANGRARSERCGLPPTWLSATACWAGVCSLPALWPRTREEHPPSTLHAVTGTVLFITWRSTISRSCSFFSCSFFCLCMFVYNDQKRTEAKHEPISHRGSIAFHRYTDDGILFVLMVCCRQCSGYVSEWLQRQQRPRGDDVSTKHNVVLQTVCGRERVGRRRGPCDVHLSSRYSFHRKSTSAYHANYPERWSLCCLNRDVCCSYDFVRFHNYGQCIVTSCILSIIGVDIELCLLYCHFQVICLKIILSWIYSGVPLGTLLSKSSR